MKALKLSSILASVAQLTGVSSRQISPEQHIAIVTAVSEGLKSVWNEYPWPELCDTQPYYLWPNEWDSRLTLNPGAIVRLTRDGATSYWRRKTPRGAGSGASAGTAVDGYWAMGFNPVASITYGTGYALLTLTNSSMTHEVVAGDSIAVIFGANTTTYPVTEIVTVSTTRTGLVLQTNSAFGMGVDFMLPYYPGSTETDAFWEAAVIDTYVTLPATVGKVLQAWDADPNLPDSYASKIDYELEGDKVRVPQDTPRVWLQTHAVELELDGTYWLATEDATVGMVRYSGTAGDCYKCILALAGNGANSAPESDATHWTLVQIPALLAPTTKYLASADILRADGKETTALAREDKAAKELERALQTVNEHQHQTARWGVKP